MVSRLSEGMMGRPLLVHSTSWRRARGSVILSFLVINHQGQAPELDGLPIRRTELARSSATEPPPAINQHQVLEHALRHLAWLVHDDATVQAELSEAWKLALADYVPEPFRHLR